ncbi:hematopoietic death receptor isoform X2 [Anabas testudineus]|uniref:hematopoietic death receptor isoform X2 n=1 Tax=Anabas testudineus TaxID=64144 RepID=UPI000E458E71|nr:hematopoietic death receptor isoform X2 [Anabas testudineus]
MTNSLLYVVISFSFFTIHFTGAFPQLHLDSEGSRTLRNVQCRAPEYPDGNVCCLNCPAGTHVKVPCTTPGQIGTCEECEDGKYTEHANGLHQCLKCILCRSDQEVVTHCTTTQNTVCQCKPGWFCAPDQACEVCKKCLRCGKDEVKVRNCTSTTNTECKKKELNPGPSSANVAVIVSLALFAAAVVAGIIIVVVIYRRKRCSATDSSRNPQKKTGQDYAADCLPEERRNGETQRSSISNWPLVRGKSWAAVEDECKVLCESLNSSASNSQYSLTGLPSSAFSALPPQACLMEDEQFPTLSPLNGEESLRRCFGYFEEMDVDYHKRFFRHLGISDNVIKGKEYLQYEDKIHELLNIWLEKEGRDASLNVLLKALLDLNQRRTAETVKESAIDNGHYVCEC